MIRALRSLKGFISWAEISNLRGVKAARKYLAEIGWLLPLESPHWHRQRWKATAVINLTWPGLTGEGKVRTKLPPRKAQSMPELPPPESNKELPSGFRNQKLDSPERAGVQTGEEKRPSLADVKLADLLNFSRTEELYRQAVARGWINHSENQALNWIGAAVRAKSVAGDPVRVFVAIVRKGLWHHITQEQEERARTALHRYREAKPDLFRLTGPFFASSGQAAKVSHSGHDLPRFPTMFHRPAGTTQGVDISQQSQASNGEKRSLQMCSTVFPTAKKNRLFGSPVRASLDIAAQAYQLVSPPFFDTPS
jgi:hypothetical protein